MDKNIKDIKSLKKKNDSKFHHPDQGSANSLCQGPDGKYFLFCWSCDVCYKYSILKAPLDNS